MSLVFCLISTVLAQGWSKTSGGTTSFISVRSSAGNHRVHSGIGGWYQNCQTSDATLVYRCWRGSMDMVSNGQDIPNGVLRTKILRPTFSMGVVLGNNPTKIGIYGGLGGQMLQGGVDNSVLLFQPGGYVSVSMQKPIGDKWMLYGNQGYFLRLWGVDADLSIGVGRRW